METGLAEILTTCDFIEITARNVNILQDEWFTVWVNRAHIVSLRRSNTTPIDLEMKYRLNCAYFGAMYVHPDSVEELLAFVKGL